VQLELHQLELRYEGIRKRAPGVERALGLMRTEIERGMKLMGCSSIDQLSRENLRFR